MSQIVDEVRGLFRVPMYSIYFLLWGLWTRASYEVGKIRGTEGVLRTTHRRQTFVLELDDCTLTLNVAPPRSRVGSSWLHLATLDDHYRLFASSAKFKVLWFTLLLLAFRETISPVSLFGHPCAWVVFAATALFIINESAFVHRLRASGTTFVQYEQAERAKREKMARKLVDSITHAVDWSDESFITMISAHARTQHTH
jgi:hypothetical protein